MQDDSGRVYSIMSLPPRGAWIETIMEWEQGLVQVGRSPRGERGLKRQLDRTNPQRGLVAPPAGSVD